MEKENTTFGIHFFCEMNLKKLQEIGKLFLSQACIQAKPSLPLKNIMAKN